MSAQGIFKREGAEDWTLERIARMTVQEIKQLRENAERLNEKGIVELCSAALKTARPHVKGDARLKTAPGTRARHLIARVKAFEARGVYLVDPRTSWGGVRREDGKVVLALWATGVLSVEGSCRYLLWSPNVDGARPWSDSPAGRERRRHCEQAMEIGGAEGLLVYGEPLAGYLPEDKAQAVAGVDAEVVLAFEVQRIGTDYWAVWGKARAASFPTRA